jgi:hypothetical protein
MSSLLFDGIEPIATADFSECRRYRFKLTRVWDLTRPVICVIGVNPSIADAQKNDPTIRKVINFARRWGAGGFNMLNLNPHISTEPADALEIVDEPIMLENDGFVRRAIHSSRVVCAWGTSASKFIWAMKRMQSLLSDPENFCSIECLGVTKEGYPRHPLYLKSGTVPVPFRFDPPMREDGR